MASEDDLRALGQSSPGGFGLATNPNFAYPPHVEYLDNALVETIYSKTKTGLICQMPPRHGKSTLISEYFPAWFLGTFPDKQVILASYEASFAMTWGFKSRALLEEFGPWLFNVHVDPRKKAMGEWRVLDHKGVMNTTGVGGGLTGRGADLLIIDDYLKNAKEADSELIRDNQWEWYASTAFNRLEPGGKICVLATRWHEDDLIGRIIANAEGTDDEFIEYDS